MRVVVTGAGGFVGRSIVEMLPGHDVIAIDNNGSAIPKLENVRQVAGDLRDQAVIEDAFSGGCDAVVHLATVPGGAAEEDPELARQVNVDATMSIASKAAATGNRPRFVFASSIAVYGDPLPAKVDDTTLAAPTMLYGAHKAMMEQFLATLTRRGELDAISLRLSGVVARPQAKSGMKSAFLSDVFHVLGAGEPFVMPVSPDATCWLTSLETGAQNFARAVGVDLESSPGTRAILLPALRVRVDALVAEIARQTGNAATLVSYEPDTSLEAAFGAYPPLATLSANELGFAGDGSLSSLVGQTLFALRNN